MNRVISGIASSQGSLLRKSYGKAFQHEMDILRTSGPARILTPCQSLLYSSSSLNNIKKEDKLFLQIL